MKNTRTLLRVGLLGVILLSFLVITQRAYRSIYALHYLAYQFDPALSPAQQHAIKARVALFEYQGSYNPRTLVAAVKSFPCVKNVSVHCLASHTAYMTVEAYEPVIRINGSCVLTDAQTIISEHAYAAYIVHNLPALTMASIPEHCSDRMMETIRRCIQERIFERYTLRWVNEHELYFSDLHDPAFSVLCDAQSLPTYPLCVSYEQIKNNVKQTNAVAYRWIADLRFHDQIIVSRDTGGCHGKSV